MKNVIRKGTLSFVIPLLALMVVACGGNTENKSETERESDAMQAEAESISAPEKKLNINTATEQAFRTIPDVGDKMVHEFEEYRPYVSIQQFRKEIGKYVDEDKVAAYEEYIFVPIDRNKSDAATLMQIPGLNEAQANSLVDARPYDSNDSFSRALSEYIDGEAMTMAEHYIKSE